MNKNINDLLPVSHKDVEPMYTKEEILNKLASAVQYGRDTDLRGDQKIVIELIYSVAKALL